MVHTVLCVVGARPNFMKVAPIIKAIKATDTLQAKLIHTGQHYDQKMKHTFFDQLGIVEPDIDLEVGSGSHAQQTAEIMKRFEPVLDEENPDVILVVGDVNSTIACALVAAKKGVPVIHVEAGLRSYDREMPEEINRVLTDQISDLLFTTESHAQNNLAREGIDTGRVYFVGNVMIDTLLGQLEKAVSPRQTLKGHMDDKQIEEGNYALLTLHRPSNVDDEKILKKLLQALTDISRTIPIVFPVHPRTASFIERYDLDALFSANENFIRLEPQGYLEMLGLMSKARIVFTDSGGIQEETTALGVPCITIRENTERPITLTEGTNTLVGTDTEKLRAVFDETIATGGKAGKVPEKWDGAAAERIVSIISDWLAARARA